MKVPLYTGKLINVPYTCTVMITSDCPSLNISIVEVVVKTAVSDGIICHVAVTSPFRPANRRILKKRVHQYLLKVT